MRRVPTRIARMDGLDDKYEVKAGSMGREECVRERWYMAEVWETNVMISGKGCGGIICIEGRAEGSGYCVWGKEGRLRGWWVRV